jgi:RNA-directed DNA polymerase
VARSRTVAVGTVEVHNHSTSRELPQNQVLGQAVRIPLCGRWLGQVVRGYFQYHAVPTNYPRLAAFHYHVTVLWLRTLRRRSQKDWSQWDRMARLAAAYLPLPRILHPWPSKRFAVKHPRWEPGARIAPAGICAGGAQQ